MTERRARNEISRSKEMSLRAADLLDEGATDSAVAAALSAEFAKPVSARTVMSFRQRDYEPVAKARIERRDAAQEVEMIISSARSYGASFARAGTDLLAKMLYDMLRNPTEELDPVAVGKSLAKIVELENDSTRLQMERAKADAARKIREAASAVAEQKLDPKDLVRQVDEIMGLKPQEAAS